MTASDFGIHPTSPSSSLAISHIVMGCSPTLISELQLSSVQLFAPLEVFAVYLLVNSIFTTLLFPAPDLPNNMMFDLAAIFSDKDLIVWMFELRS